jgi:SAM-dependent methyltransferase
VSAEAQPLLDPCAASPFVAAYVRELAGSGQPLETRIHPADEMYLHDLRFHHGSPEAAALLYFSAGHQIFRTVEEIVAWRFRGFGGVRSFLDFAGGYGRFGRFLARHMEPQRITVAEIDPGGVRFQQEILGVRGCVSGADPETFRPDGSFDVLFASSFFSHLPARRFEAWLARLQSLIAPGGALIFSVHGMHLLSESEVRASNGIVFRPVSETTRLDGSEYGTSYVTPEFVRGVADRVAAGDRLLAFPSGLGGFQDLYVLLRPPLPPVLDLRPTRFPFGACDRAAVSPDGVVSAEGWALGDVDERPPEIRLFLRDTVAATLPGDGEYGAWRRWSFSFPLSAVGPDDVVRVEARSARGLSKILILSPMRPYLPAAPL